MFGLALPPGFRPKARSPPNAPSGRARRRGAQANRVRLAGPVLPARRSSGCRSLLKGADLAIASRWSEGWEYRRHGPLLFLPPSRRMRRDTNDTLVEVSKTVSGLWVRRGFKSLPSAPSAQTRPHAGLRRSDALSVQSTGVRGPPAPVRRTLWWTD